MLDLPITDHELALVALVAALIALVALVARILLPKKRARVVPLPDPPPAAPMAFHQTMVAGREYMVTRAFTDFDGQMRPAGERWVFKGYDFLPYDDGLTLFTEPGPGVRLQWRPETQGAIIDNLGDYLSAV